MSELFFDNFFYIYGLTHFGGMFWCYRMYMIMKTEIFAYHCRRTPFFIEAILWLFFVFFYFFSFFICSFFVLKTVPNIWCLLFYYQNLWFFLIAFWSFLPNPLYRNLNSWLRGEFGSEWINGTVYWRYFLLFYFYLMRVLYILLFVLWLSIPLTWIILLIYYFV